VLGRRDWSSVAAVVAAVKGMRARAITVVIWWVGVLVSGFLGRLFVRVGKPGKVCRIGQGKARQERWWEWSSIYIVRTHLDS
jgi:hypothetical protein